MSNLLHVEPNLEHADNSIWGCATIRAMDLQAYWYYRNSTNKVLVGNIYIENRPTVLQETDAIYQEILNTCIDAVQVFLGRAEVAAEMAYEAQQEREAEDEAVGRDECVEMKVRDRIEEKYEQAQRN